MGTRHWTLLILLCSLLLPAQSMVAAQYENSENMDSDRAIPYISEQGNLHLFVYHERVDWDAVSASLYHQMKTEDGWTTPKLLGEELAEGFFVGSGSPGVTNRIVAVTSDTNGITIYYNYYELKDPDTGIYKLTFDESTKTWTSMEPVMTIEDVHSILEIPFDESNYVNGYPQYTINLKIHRARLLDDGSLVTSWSYRQSSGEKYNTTYFTRSNQQEHTLLTTKDSTTKWVHYFNYRDGIIDYVYDSDYDAAIEYARFTNINDSWTEQTSRGYGQNIIDFRTPYSDAYMYINQSSDVLELTDFVSPTQYPLGDQSLADFDEYSNPGNLYMGENQSRVHFSEVGNSILTWETYDSYNGTKLTSRSLDLGDREPRRLEMVFSENNSTQAHFVWSDDYQLEEHHNEIFGVQHTDNWGEISQYTHSAEFTNDYRSGGNMISTLDPISSFQNRLILAVLVGFAILHRRRSRSIREL